MTRRQQLRVQEMTVQQRSPLGGFGVVHQRSRGSWARLFDSIVETTVGSMAASPSCPRTRSRPRRDPAGADAARIRALHNAIATPHSTPHYWSSLGRSDEQWQEFLSVPDRLHYIATAKGKDFGWAGLHVTPAGQNEITAFGIRHDAVGRGYGGAFLTEVVRQAWLLLAASKGPSGCVWLTTTSWDHPHALADYLARGFRVSSLELRQQTGADRRRTAPVEEPPRYLVRPAVAADARPVAELIEELGFLLPAATVQTAATVGVVIQ